MQFKFPVLSKGSRGTPDKTSGKIQAQTALYSRLSSAVYPTALRITVRPEDAEDAMQEAFLRLFRLPEKQFSELSENEDRMTAWLRRTAANCSVDILRRKMPFAEDSDSGERQESTEEEPERDLSHDIEAIHKAVMELPTSYRTILSLLLFEGYDIEECSQILGLNPGNLRVLYMRARRKLLTKLQENG